VRQMIVGNPARFGITHTTNQLVDRACTTPVETSMITSAWAYVCSPSSPVSQPVSATFAEQALFSDHEHWATGGHNVLGSYYYCPGRRHLAGAVPASGQRHLLPTARAAAADRVHDILPAGHSPGSPALIATA